ncbi:hydrogenase maturation nickel metallochaperone HypA [Desulfurobacterium atlanticum]|uniref:Hydrogenase maturation factor HypA n=1 Tax=Desulfurobacterium atlanticum TaxID=240169 RepID=A0A238YDH8_9BACT|nr:hydrogenase maturation nickel metallochaperone HypA [Desulfurobacterium atlanticum]SNR69275.1 hydrogenase nickel incorporation protein HypA/HybF [Desulfurobacterium atlanticum]
MHETSLVIGMLEKITEIAEKENAKKVLKVKVKIGKLSGVVIDSFKFAFDTMKREFPFTENAVLEIVEVPAVYRCFDCGKEFETETAYFPECPYCKSFNITIVSGEELQIVDLEIDV